MKNDIIEKIKKAIEAHLYENIVIGLRADNYKYTDGDELYCSTHQIDGYEDVQELDGTCVVPLWQGEVGRYEIEDVIEEISEDWDYILDIVRKYNGKYITIAISNRYELGWDEYDSCRQELIACNAICIAQIER
ncbi:MAG: hypothetical protein GYA16_15635 [Spirochaetes bacterium]|nr:hypothetical protein [Spirochaetota bacterium]